MNRRYTNKLAVVLLLSIAVVAVAIAAWSDEQTDDLQKAYIEGKLKLQDVVAARDSVFALVNQMYAPVKPILQSSCFDCHSQNTCYPWYHSIPLIKGMIDEHVTEGREHLDMTNDFPFSGKENSLKLLEEIKEEIEEGKMPPLSYRMLHWGKLIEGAERDSVFSWIDTTTAILTDFYSGLVPQTSDSTE